MNILGRLERAEKAIATLHGPEIPGIVVTYHDGTTIHTTGICDSVTAILGRGDVQRIDGDDDLVALAWALTGPLSDK